MTMARSFVLGDDQVLGRFLFLLLYGLLRRLLWRLCLTLGRARKFGRVRLLLFFPLCRSSRYNLRHTATLGSTGVSFNLCSYAVTIGFEIVA